MIDLHCHSLFSDGTESPEVLASLAEAAGLRALALTDHDTLDGLPKFLAMQPQVRTRLVTGIELSCRFATMEIHVLGLLVDPQDPTFRTRVQDLQVRRHERNLRMAERLRTIGIPITFAEVAELATSKLISRVHFAKALVKRGIAGSRFDAFARYLGEGRPAHVPFEDLSVAEAAAWIKESGGVPVVAHPGRSSNRSFRWEEAMAELKAQGIEGLEAYYSDYSPREEQYFRELAQTLDLVASGGSDYHGHYKPGISLGVGRGALRVPDEVLDQLEARRGMNSGSA